MQVSKLKLSVLFARRTSSARVFIGFVWTADVLTIGQRQSQITASFLAQKKLGMRNARVFDALNQPRFDGFVPYDFGKKH